MFSVEAVGRNYRLFPHLIEVRFILDLEQKTAVFPSPEGIKTSLIGCFQVVAPRCAPGWLLSLESCGWSSCYLGVSSLLCLQCSSPSFWVKLMWITCCGLQSPDLNLVEHLWVTGDHPWRISAKELMLKQTPFSHWYSICIFSTLNFHICCSKGCYSANS